MQWKTLLIVGMLLASIPVVAAQDDESDDLEEQEESFSSSSSEEEHDDDLDEEDDDDKEERDNSSRGREVRNASEERRQDDHDEDEDEEDDEDDDDRSRGKGARSQELPRIYDGHHIGFESHNGSLLNYSVDGVAYFAAISTEDALESAKRHGAAFELEGDDAEIRLIDSAAANLRIEGDFSLEAAEGTSFELNGSQAYLLDADGQILMKFRGEDLHLDNGTLMGEELRGNSPVGQRSQTLEDAISDGDVIASVEVDEDGANATSLGDANITTTQDGDQVTITVDGEGEGKALYIALDESQVSDLSNLNVTFDGERIPLADSLEDALDQSDGQAEYVILVTAEGFELVVGIPHFSVHEIGFQTSSGSVTPVIPYGSLAIGAAIAAVAVGLSQVVRHRRN